MSQVIAHDINEKVRTADVEVRNDCTFEFLLLSRPVLQGLNESGFYKPSPIQLKGIPLGKCGLDLIVKSKSGTGKTLVFAIVALEMVQTSIEGTQVLIMAPTREIADQICNVISIIGKHIPGLNVGLFIGGLPYKKDVVRVKNCHIAVGAPGRIKHLIEAKRLDVKRVKLFVLDEADKLMESDFQNAINYCYHMLPEHKQFIATSATIPIELKTYLERYMNSPTYISLEVNSPLLLGLRQFVSVLPKSKNVVQESNAKNEEVCKLLSKVSFTQCIIFCNYQQRAESVSNIINQRGWKSLYISGSQPQETRLKVINKFKSLECNILLTTNLTARGIDASNVDFVINYDIPCDTVTYLHRVGRTGRYGSLGVCVSLIASEKDLLYVRHILGDIGGVELSIAKLPADMHQDLWKEELSSFEQIHGLVDAEREKVNWNFLEETNTPTWECKKKKKGRRKGSVSQSEVKEVGMDTEIQDEFAGVSTDELLRNLAKGLKIEAPNKESESAKPPVEIEPVVMQSPKKAKKNEEESANFISDQFMGISTESLLKKLAQGEKIEPSEELVNPADLYPWIPVEESVLSKGGNAINLLDSCSDSESSDKELDVSNEILNKKVTLTKNVALYHVGKLLNCDNWDKATIQDAVQPIQEYLNITKENTDATLMTLDNLTKGVSNDELLENLSLYSKKLAECTPKDSTSENICRVAYEHIIGGAKDWRNLVKVGYKSEEMAVEPETEVDVVTSSLNASNYNGAYEDNILAPYETTYTQYFDYYENVLSENALTFEDVPSFHTWFHEWQTQLKSVTNYVQQHIYLQEMNNYQYSNYY